jgi:hypothetical protein
MSTRRHRNEQPVRLPPLLVCLIHAAKYVPDELASRPGHDAALTDLARWALVRVPSEGVLAHDSSHAFTTIQRIAQRHLQLGEARKSLKHALSTIEAFETRDAIESATNHVQSVSDTVYYYAGLACGIALMHLDSSRW